MRISMFLRKACCFGGGSELYWESEVMEQRDRGKRRGRTCLNISMHTLRQTPLTHHNSSSLLTNPDRLSAFIYSPFATRKAFMRAGTVYISNIPLSAQSCQMQLKKKRKKKRSSLFFSFFFDSYRYHDSRRTVFVSE